ncbi:hypothetical protein LKB26_005279 [Salmonella enterica]|nr:hypothetical protein [Salmonella enterica]EIK6201697.1 hypothetical protein [Salmonella enterica]
MANSISTTHIIFLFDFKNNKLKYLYIQTLVLYTVKNYTASFTLSTQGAFVFVIKVKKMLLSLPAVPGMDFKSCNLLILLSEQEPDLVLTNPHAGPGCTVMGKKTGIKILPGYPH